MNRVSEEVLVSRAVDLARSLDDNEAFFFASYMHLGQLGVRPLTPGDLENALSLAEELSTQPRAGVGTRSLGLARLYSTIGKPNGPRYPE